MDTGIIRTVGFKDRRRRMPIKHRRIKANNETRQAKRREKLPEVRGAMQYRRGEVVNGRWIRGLRFYKPVRTKRVKYPHKRFWEVITFRWVESYDLPVSSFFKNWINSFKTPYEFKLEPGQLYPVAVEGLTETREATVEWPVSYSDPRTLH